MSHNNDSNEAGSAVERPSYDDVNTPVIVLIGAISAIVTLLVVMFVQGLCYHLQNSYERQRAAQVEHRPSREVVEAQKKVLDGGDGVIAISDAMTKVVSTYGK
jgi:hypothetical protein